MLILAACLCVAFVLYTVFFYARRSSSRSGNDRQARTHCSVCGAPSVVWEGQYCSPECETRLARSMDDMHDRSEDTE